MPYAKISTFTCAECGVEFETRNRRQKYCTKACRAERNKRVYQKTYAKARVKRSEIVDVACEQCGEAFSYRLFATMRPRRFCSKGCYYAQRDNSALFTPRSRPKTDLTATDLRVIQAIWQALDYHALDVFGGRTDLCEIYPKLFSKELFHEWVVFTIIFQSHLEHRYETVIQIPGVGKSDFLRLCDKYNITLQDSEAFAEDMRLAA